MIKYKCSCQQEGGSIKALALQRLIFAASRSIFGTPAGRTPAHRSLRSQDDLIARREIHFLLSTGTASAAAPGCFRFKYFASPNPPQMLYVKYTHCALRGYSSSLLSLRGTRHSERSGSTFSSLSSCDRRFDLSEKRRLRSETSEPSRTFVCVMKFFRLFPSRHLVSLLD